MAYCRPPIVKGRDMSSARRVVRLEVGVTAPAALTSNVSVRACVMLLPYVMATTQLELVHRATASLRTSSFETRSTGAVIWASVESL
jgi:hypothetical protein